MQSDIIIELQNTHADYRTKLVVIPKAPQLFGGDEDKGMNEQVEKLMCHQKEISRLTKANATGFLLRELEKDRRPGDNKSAIFIPSSLDKLCLIVPITKIEKAVEKTASKVVLKLSKQFELQPELASDEYETGVIFLVEQNKANEQLVQKFVQKSMELWAEKSSNLQISFQFVFESRSMNKKQKTELIQLFNKTTNKTKPGSASRLARIIVKVPKTRQFKLTGRDFSRPDVKKYTLHDTETLSRIYREFFPQTENRLEVLTDYEENWVNRTDEKGHLRNADDVIGELKNFLAEFVYKTKGRKGVLLRNYTHWNLNTLLEDQLEASFEMDWLFLGQKIVLFEVGRSKTPEEPENAFKKKLEQTITRHYAAIQMITYFIAKEASPVRDAKLSSLVADSFILVVYFPNIPTKSFEALLQRRSEVVFKEAQSRQGTKDYLYNFLQRDIRPKLVTICKSETENADEQRPNVDCLELVIENGKMTTKSTEEVYELLTTPIGKLNESDETQV